MRWHPVRALAVPLSAGGFERSKPQGASRAHAVAHATRPQDKNPDNVSEAEAQFKFIAEAFETLGDELRRADYDRGGAAAPSHSDDFGDASASGTSGGVYGDPRQRYGGGGGFYAHAVDPFEIFNAFFGGRGGGDPFATFMVRSFALNRTADARSPAS